jgi:hypothetical protein
MEGITAWASELGIDFTTWHDANPLALNLSRIASPVIFLWTFRAGRAAGYSVFVDCQLTERKIVGRIDQLSDVPVIDSRKNWLGEALKETLFDYARFMSSAADFEIATAELTKRFSVGVHLVDVMDMVEETQELSWITDITNPLISLAGLASSMSGGHSLSPVGACWAEPARSHGFTASGSAFNKALVTLQVFTAPIPAP